MASQVVIELSDDNEAGIQAELVLLGQQRKSVPASVDDYVKGLCQPRIDEVTQRYLGTVSQAVTAKYIGLDAAGRAVVDAAIEAQAAKKALAQPAEIG